MIKRNGHFIKREEVGLLPLTAICIHHGFKNKPISAAGTVCMSDTFWWKWSIISLQLQGAQIRILMLIDVQ